MNFKTIKFNTLYCVILSIVFIDNIFANQIKFEHLTTEQGLSHSWISCIYQDDQDFMWFGTFDGLNKFDGYDFITYRHNLHDPNSLPSNVIRSICEGDSGNLWIATMQGICFYDRRKDIFINYNENNGYDIENIDVLDVFQDSQGFLWIGTNHNGLYQYDISKNQMYYYAHDQKDSTSLSRNNVRQIFEDSNGNLWIATDKGLNIFNRDTKTFNHIIPQDKLHNSIAGNKVYAITEDANGNLWFACYGDGLSKIHVDEIETGSFINYKFNPNISNSLASNLILTLYPDNNGGLWIGTENSGLDYLENDGKTFIHFKNDPNDPNSISNNSIYSLFQDKMGDLWIGTYSKGVNIIYPNKQAFKHYKNLPMNPNSLSNNAVWDFSEDKEGSIWIATDGGGLNKFNPKTVQFKSYNSSNTNLNSDAVIAVYVDSENNVWIGTWTGGISLFNRESSQFITYTSENSDLSNNNVLDIDEDENGNLWLATQLGLNRFDKKEKSFLYYKVHESTIPTNFLEVVVVDHRNHILLGSTQGLIIFDPKTEKFKSYRHNPENINSISNEFVTSIYEENDSTVWIGTSHGLNKLNRKTNRITRYFSSDGLLNDLIFAIEKDDQRQLWISSNGGISRYNPQTRFFKNFTTEDGLQGKTFIKKSSYKSRDGKIYFGGDNGFNVFNPKEVIENTEIPEIIITDFHIFNKPVLISNNDSPLKEHISYTKSIILSYQQSVFSFKFTALNYILPSKNQYAYMLEGFDKEWNYIGTKRTATYTNIDPGEYMFKVKGSNNDGYWNEEGTRIKIIITPPFWATLWFRFLVIILIIVIIISLFYYRTNRIRKYNKELEENVKVRTQQLESSNKELETFAYSVSHDLRTPLRGINAFTKLIQQDFEKNLSNESKHYINKIIAACERMNILIDSLLNLSRIMRKDIKRERINLSNLANEIIEELIIAHPDRKVDYHIQKNMYANVDIDLFYTALQNLLQNAWKFTRSKNNTVIEFGCIHNSDEIQYYIRDNGIGFDMAYLNKLFVPFNRLHKESEFEGMGIGLAGVQRIIEKHGGKIWAEGKINEGAVFYFTITDK